MKTIQTLSILLMTLLLSSCQTQTQQPGQFVGVKFCQPGIFKIHSDIDQWTMVGNGLWKGQLAQLDVISTAKNMPKKIPGFFLIKDKNGNIRLQAEVCKNSNHPISKLDILLVSSVNPGTLSLDMKENITDSNNFVAFNASHFQCANIHPKQLTIDQENQQILIRMLFENLPQPLIKKQPPKQQALKRPVKETIYSGLYFDDIATFEITGTIPTHEWKQLQPGHWVAKLQRVKVYVQNVTCDFSGFRFYQKDKLIDKHRYQMEIDASKKGQTQGPPLEILIKSNQPPGTLTFSTTQKRTSHQSEFIPFSADQFILNNQNRASFLIHDFFTDRAPSICLTFLNISNPAQKKKLPQIIKKHDYAIFTPFARSVSKSLSNKITDSFLKSLEKKLIDYIQAKKLNIRTLNYPNNYDPFSEHLLNSPVITLGQHPKDRIVSVIQDNLQHTHYIAFPQLSEDLLKKTLSFTLFVYSKNKQSVTTISEYIDLTPNIQKNILTAMTCSVEKLASLSIHQVTATTAQTITTQVSSGSYKSYEAMYDFIQTNHLYCTPDISNLDKQRAIQEIGSKRNLSDQDVLKKMKTFTWESKHSIKDDTHSGMIFQIIYNVKTEHIHDFTKPIHSIFMHCLLRKNVTTQSKLLKICKSMKNHAGIDNWRVPTIEELIRIFQVKDLDQRAKRFSNNTHYQFWSNSPTNQKNAFWLLNVQWDQNGNLHLDIEMATSAVNARMLIVSDNK